MINYVCGFMFSADLSKVVLIKKVAKPGLEHFENLLNGVGGKIKPKEGVYGAMSREFYEETGLETRAFSWYLFKIVEYKEGLVKFFYTIGDVNAVKTMEAEEVGVYNVADIGTLPVIPNLRELIPTALTYLK